MGQRTLTDIKEDIQMANNLTKRSPHQMSKEKYKLKKTTTLCTCWSGQTPEH